MHFGIGPWIGLLAAVPVAMACGAIIGFLAFRFGVARRLFRDPDHRVRRVRAHRLRPFRLGRRLGRLLPAGRAVHAERSVEPARQADHVLLRDAGADRRGVSAVPLPAAQPHRLLLAGDPRGRGGRARARHRHVPLQDVRGGDLRRHDGGRRRVLRVLLQQPVSRAGLPHLALDRADPRRRSSAASARCSARSSARSCSPACPKS